MDQSSCHYYFGAMAQSGTAADSKSVEPSYGGVRVQIPLAPLRIKISDDKEQSKGCSFFILIT